MPVIQLGENTSIVGTYYKSLYDADDFHIIDMQAPYTEGKFPTAHTTKEVTFTAKGKFAAPDYKGQTLEVVGEWRYDNKYKSYVFVVDYTIPSLPKTENDSIKFIKSVRGLGDKMARRICAVFHEDMEKAAEDPDVLVASIKGMKASKAEAFCDAVKRVNISAEMTRMLKDMVSSTTIRNIAVKYGTEAMQIMTENPYKMVTERCISFKEADTIAAALGWKKDAPQRLTTGILSTIRGIKLRNASIIAEKDVVSRYAIGLLNVDESLIKETTEKLQASHEIVSAGKYWYLLEDYKTEKGLSDVIVQYAKDVVAPKDAMTYEAWRKLLEYFKEQNVETIVDAFDSDRATNSSVANAIKKLHEIAKEYGYEMKTWNWGTEQKGVDDYLLAQKIKREKVEAKSFVVSPKGFL